LASASPRRLDILRQVGIEPQVIIANKIEKTEGSPVDIVQYITLCLKRGMLLSKW
jgi:predicted house-cleaning NTP pyrophosphatase (Maf/HAM1 superfamily)